MTRTQQFIALMMVASRIAVASNIQEDRYAPVINQSPRHYIIFKVCKSAAIHQVINVKIEAFYHTQNDACQLVASKFEGAKYDRETSLYYEIFISPSASCVTKKIPLDGLVSNYCGWILSTLDYRVLPFAKEMPTNGLMVIEKKSSRCLQNNASTFYVNRDNKIFKVVRNPRYSHIALNCKTQKYRINIEEEKNANHS